MPSCRRAMKRSFSCALVGAGDSARAAARRARAARRSSASFGRIASSGGTSEVDLDVARHRARRPRTREDQQLAAHVFARQVVARIGLGVAGVARLPHQRRERPHAVVVIEQPRQRTGQHAGDRMDAIATGLQLAQRAQQRQARADGGAVAVAGIRRSRAAARIERQRDSDVPCPSLHAVTTWMPCCSQCAWRAATTSLAVASITMRAPSPLSARFDRRPASCAAARSASRCAASAGARPERSLADCRASWRRAPAAGAGRGGVPCHAAQPRQHRAADRAGAQQRHARRRVARLRGDGAGDVRARRSAHRLARSAVATRQFGALRARRRGRRPGRRHARCRPTAAAGRRRCRPPRAPRPTSPRASSSPDARPGSRRRRAIRPA